MKLTPKHLALFFITGLMGLSGCDSPQQAMTDDKPRIEFGLHEHDKEFGDYVIHVNALTTDQLPAEVARNYKITRSKSNAMLNVVITKKTDGVEKPTTGMVNTVTRNLASQLKDMKMYEITEQEAIYYIGEVPVDNEETLVFYIDVTPTSESKPFLLTYRQQFFTK